MQKHPATNDIIVFNETIQKSNINKKIQKSKWVAVVGTTNVCPVNFLITFQIVETFFL